MYIGIKSSDKGYDTAHILQDVSENAVLRYYCVFNFKEDLKIYGTGKTKYFFSTVGYARESFCGFIMANDRYHAEMAADALIKKQPSWSRLINLQIYAVR